MPTPLAVTQVATAQESKLSDYGKSPELISEPINFNDDQSFPSAALDKAFREIAWKAVVEHPLSGVTDKNRNGIGDHLE